jgi:hypothetical protein
MGHESSMELCYMVVNYAIIFISRSRNLWNEYQEMPVQCDMDTNTIELLGLKIFSSHQIQLLDVHSLCLQNLFWYQWCVWSGWEIWFGMTELFLWTNHLPDKHKKALLDLILAISYILFIVAQSGGEWFCT